MSGTTVTKEAVETTVAGQRTIITSEEFAKQLVEAVNSKQNSRDFAMQLYGLPDDATDEQVTKAMRAVTSKRQQVAAKIREVNPEFQLPKLAQASRQSNGRNLLSIFDGIKSDTEEATA